MRRMLITLVIVMGVLILVGTVALVWGIVNKLGDAPAEGVAVTRTDMARSPVLGLGLPAGAALQRFAVRGEWMFLHIRVPEASATPGIAAGDWIYVVPLSGGAPWRLSLTARPVPGSGGTMK